MQNDQTRFSTFQPSTTNAQVATPDYQSSPTQERKSFENSPVSNFSLPQNQEVPVTQAQSIPQAQETPETDPEAVPVAAKTINQEPRVENKSKTPADNDLFGHLPKPLPEETIYTWTSASRPFKKRNRQFYTTVGTIVFLISLILFFAGQFLPIAVVISVAFLAYVLSSVPPHLNEKKISTYGIRVENELYFWEEMGRFWFDKKYDSQLLLIEIARFPWRLTLVLGDTPQHDLEELLKEVLLMQKPEESFLDKASAWLQEKIPLDTN